MENTIEINYEALDNMVARLENGAPFSLNAIREIFGDVVDDAIDSERTTNYSTITV